MHAQERLAEVLRILFRRHPILCTRVPRQENPQRMYVVPFYPILNQPGFEEFGAACSIRLKDAESIGVLVIVELNQEHRAMRLSVRAIHPQASHCIHPIIQAEILEIFK